MGARRIWARRGAWRARRSAAHSSTPARRGDKLALEAFATAGHYLGIAIASFLNIFNPELVVIGGGVGGALPYMRKTMTAQVRARAFTAIASQAKIVRAALGPRGGVVGAAYAALHPLHPMTRP